MIDHQILEGLGLAGASWRTAGGIPDSSWSFWIGADDDVADQVLELADAGLGLVGQKRARVAAVMQDHSISSSWRRDFLAGQFDLGQGADPAASRRMALTSGIADMSADNVKGFAFLDLQRMLQHKPGQLVETWIVHVDSSCR